MIQTDGYNISATVRLFHSIPHLQLTNEGLISMTNHTFDYDRLPYVNSILVFFLIPLIVLLLLFAFYIFYILLIRCLTLDRYEDKQNVLNQQRICHFVFFTFGLISISTLLFGMIILYKG